MSPAKRAFSGSADRSSTSAGRTSSRRPVTVLTNPGGHCAYNQQALLCRSGRSNPLSPDHLRAPRAVACCHHGADHAVAHMRARRAGTWRPRGRHCSRHGSPAHGLSTRWLARSRRHPDNSARYPDRRRLNVDVRLRWLLLLSGSDFGSAARLRAAGGTGRRP
jgi:hypothetical protein